MGVVIDCVVLLRVHFKCKYSLKMPNTSQINGIPVLVADIYDYVGPTCNNLRGEAVLRADHVVRCGLKNIEVFAYVLKSSGVLEDPHTVNIKLSKDPQKWACECSCKAGKGGKCKHVVAVLFHVNR